MILTDVAVVHEIPVLTADGCADIRARVMTLRGSWLRRNPYVPFFTLGAASYIDGPNGAASYGELARQFNPVLEENFASLYQAAAGALSDYLDAPVMYDPRLALPGFHIYLSSKVFERPVASIHCDSQYGFHDWSGMDADLGNPLSFTLPIVLPKNGGGLNLWDIRLAELTDLTPEETAGLIRRRECTYQTYSVGRMAVHSGHVLHQAAPGRDVQPEDERITLQGHGIRADGVWRLYW